jgi:hypothetical protein
LIRDLRHLLCAAIPRMPNREPRRGHDLFQLLGG